ncbi:membrane-bound lytic transglycosylase A [Crocosphaera subtropica ATCC 51142]|uniref:peptidoglycan lytic exotransglycosylase n=1 Tax=Crocosphaera subtropica (strain ATCC 51142 / BH68) TaxID=43989 RepID=B1X1H0_CROS5|nr:murein transglycosylase A [Crocosphaera subtropica]ACB51399.1 membrane-bound lytic transglycosylase A [Crocosphaera subtropica ATCC 51142]
MNNIIPTLCLGLGFAFYPTQMMMAQQLPLRQVNPTEINTIWSEDEQLWGTAENPGDKWSLIRAISYSLRYLDTPKAAEVYENYPISGITRDRVRRSLIRFKELLKTAKTPKALQAAIEKEFTLYQSVGHDNQGTVHFTGYFEPVYTASRQRTSEYRYPLYLEPKDFANWKKPHPTRLELEGKDGLGNNSIIRGNELIWMRDRLEAYLVHVQGSARLKLTNGETITVGYDSSTDYPYVSIGKEVVNDGIFALNELTLPRLMEYLNANPEQLSNYLPRNNRFIFFRETDGAPPQGNLSVPVTAERSIATDKSIMPPGALALIKTPIPYLTKTGEIEAKLVSRYVLDQDTGSAIKGPGRVDIFMGTGKEAGDRAGLISNEGQLYYLLLKN